MTTTSDEPADQGFSAFMAGALPGLLRFGYVLTGDRHRGEELVQSALVAAYRKWKHLRDEPHPLRRRGPRAPRDAGPCS